MYYYFKHHLIQNARIRLYQYFTTFKEVKDYRTTVYISSTQYNI
jgi:hypothetical protein